MKRYNSNYLGIVINSNDPEHRGRVQVFIPHIMPALYKSWNEEGKDIKLTCVGDNIPDAINSELLDRLTKILPWAEAASPIIGASAPGNLISKVVQGVKQMAQAAGGAVSEFLQSPTLNASDNADQAALFGNASKYGGNSASQLASSNGTGKCAMGARQVIGAMTNNRYFANGLSSGGSAKAASLTVGGGNNYLQKSGYYNSAEKVPDNYDKDPSQWKIGDVRASAGGDSEGNGHVQVYTGKGWVSDFTQRGVGGVSGKYNNQTLVRMNDVGLKAAESTKLTSATNSKPAGNGTPERVSESAKPAAITPLASPDGKVSLATPPTPAVSGGGQGISGTVSGGGTATTGNPKLASDRNARFGSELGANQEQVLARLQVLASREVGSNPASIQAFTESVVNRAYFSNRSLDKVLYESGYGFTDKTTATPSPAVREAFNKVMSGGNMTNLATDAGFNLPNSGRGKGGLFITGMQSKDYVITGAIDNKTGKQITDPALLNKLYTEGDKTGKYEFFVRQSRATSAGGIEKYAQENGIKSDGFTTDLSPTLDASSSSPSVVNNTDGHGRTSVQNTNDSAKGLFAYPNPGAMVWVFFREGNPLFPVYFAASYSSSEWSSAYRGNSEADGYANNPNINSRSTHFNPNEAGGISFNVTTDLSDTTGIQDQASVMLYGDDGSNMMLSKGYHQIYTRHNRRDQVDADRFVTTGGYKEEWIDGDDSVNVRGNVYVKIGKIDDETMAAAQKLADYSKQMNDAQLSSGGSGAAKSSTPPPLAAKTIAAAQKLPVNDVNSFLYPPTASETEWLKDANKKISMNLNANASAQASTDFSKL